MLCKSKLIRFLDPLLVGDYPPSMHKLVAERLPEIGAEASRFLKGTLDFVGINHYTTMYARNDRIGIRKLIMQDASTDSGVITTRKDARTMSFCQHHMHLHLYILFPWFSFRFEAWSCDWRQSKSLSFSSSSLYVVNKI